MQVMAIWQWFLSRFDGPKKKWEAARKLKIVTFNHGVQGSNPCGLTTFSIGFNILNYLDAVLSSVVDMLDNSCSPFTPFASLLIACSASRA